MRNKSSPPLWVLRAAALVAAVSLWATGCTDSTSAALRVGPVAWTAQELLGVTPERRLDLAAITALGLAVAQGEEERISTPLAERELRWARIRILAAELALEAAEVEDDALEAHYLGNPEWELEVRHLVRLVERSDEDEVRQAARAAAAEARRRVLEGEAFEVVAGEVSEEPGARERGGLLQPGREGSWVREFWEAALALDPGGISPVVESEYGYHVLKLERRAPVPFQEARPNVVRAVAPLLHGSDPTGALLRRTEEEMVLDLDALEAWWRGGESAAPVALWHGEGVTGGEVVQELQTLEGVPLQALRAGGLEAWGTFLPRAAAELILDRRAGARGIQPPDGEVEAHRRGAARTTMGLTAPFRFTPGMDRDQLKSQAMEGLRGTAQSLRMGREALSAHLPLLLLAWPVELDGEPVYLP